MQTINNKKGLLLYQLNGSVNDFRRGDQIQLIGESEIIEGEAEPEVTVQPEVEIQPAPTLKLNPLEKPKELDGIQIGDRVRFDVSHMSKLDQKEMRSDCDLGKFVDEIGIVTDFEFCSFSKTWDIQILFDFRQPEDERPSLPPRWLKKIDNEVEDC